MFEPNRRVFDFKSRALNALIIALNFGTDDIEKLAEGGGLELKIVVQKNFYLSISAEQEFYLLHLVKEYIERRKAVELEIQALEESTGIYRDDKSPVDWDFEFRLLDFVIEGRYTEEQEKVLMDYYSAVKETRVKIGELNQ